MKKSKWIFISILISLILIGVAIYFYSNNTNDENNYNSQRTSINEEDKNNNIKQENSQTSNNSVNDTDVNITTNKNNGSSNETVNTPTAEVTIASFSTKIYSKDSARQNNIRITCNTLNNTIVDTGNTFSFCNTVGQATSSKGYQKADIFDKNGKKKKGLGGGNCQISSTLYNTVLQVPSLVVTERHEHSNNVPYVPKGKDAAVAYGSYDFKFVNHTGTSLKIKAENTENNVTIRLLKLE